MENKKAKIILAKVFSNKMDKSATVIVERQNKTSSKRKIYQEDK